MQLSCVLEAYSKASDPKLRCNASVIIGAYLKASLQLSLGDYDAFSSRWSGGELMVDTLLDLLLALTGDESHLVVKAVCNTAKVCVCVHVYVRACACAHVVHLCEYCVCGVCMYV